MALIVINVFPLELLVESYNLMEVIHNFYPVIHRIVITVHVSDSHEKLMNLQASLRTHLSHKRSNTVLSGLMHQFGTASVSEFYKI